MRPYPEELYRAINLVLAQHLMPELQTAFSQREAGIVMLLFNIAQRDYDSAVPDLINENAKLRTLLDETSGALAAIDRDDARAARSTLDALPPRTDSLRLSALRAENDALRGAVSMLAPLIEPAADDASLSALRDVRTKVYAHLKADAQRRAVPMLG
jgi:hypothetical protein